MERNPRGAHPEVCEYSNLDDRRGMLPVAVKNPQTGITDAAGTGIPLRSFAQIKRFAVAECWSGRRQPVQ